MLSAVRLGLHLMLYENSISPNPQTCLASMTAASHHIAGVEGGRQNRLQ